MRKFVSLFKKPGILIGLLFSFFLASVIIVVALFMGQEAGNFVIEVEGGDQKKSVRLCEKLDGKTVTRLEAPSVTEMSDSTYNRFKSEIEIYHQNDGLYMDEVNNVYAYSFWMINEGAETLTIQASMYYSNVTNDLDKAVRIYTVTSTQNQRMCYQRQDDEPTDYGEDYPSITYFKNENTVFEEEFRSVDPGTQIKYTILLWLEGNDPDCTDERRLGQIRFALKLSVL